MPYAVQRTTYVSPIHGPLVLVVSLKPHRNYYTHCNPHHAVSHSEGARGLYGTISAYVTLRVFGVPADDPICRRTQRVIKEWGGCTRLATWGKMLLSTMNLYDWEGINKGLPELWLVIARRRVM